MEVAVVIAARDAERTLGATLDGLSAQTLAEPFEVVVVDNGSRDGTAALAEAHPLAPQVIRRVRGEGPGAARNDGVAATTAPVIAFTDSDCVPTPGWLAAGLAATRDADLVQGRVSPPSGTRRGPFDHALRIVEASGLYEAANLFVRREAFTGVGGFRDWVNADHRNGGPPARPFGEDVVAGWRMRRLGARTAFAEAAEVHHLVLPGSARDYLAERARDGLFAGLVRQVPELRPSLWHGLFLGPRAAAADLAVAGAVAAAARRTPVPLLAALPWLRLVRREARERGGTSRSVTATVAVGDLIAVASRVRGSLRWRTPVLDGMALQNRVTPLSELIADPARGLVYGNRGCLHDDHGNITRFTVTQRWIACRLEFKGWHREHKLQPGRFTELFFLDEATAFAAGHRPCALCRREDYNRLKARWGGADALDARLDAERRDGTRRRLHTARAVPDGAFVLHADAPHLVLGDTLRPWSPAGYGAPVARPRGAVRMITPPTLAELLADGWLGVVALLHPTATQAR